MFVFNLQWNSNSIKCNLANDITLVESSKFLPVIEALDLNYSATWSALPLGWISYTAFQVLAKLAAFFKASWLRLRYLVATVHLFLFEMSCSSQALIKINNFTFLICNLEQLIMVSDTEHLRCLLMKCTASIHCHELSWDSWVRHLIYVAWISSFNVGRRESMCVPASPY